MTPAALGAAGGGQQHVVAEVLWWPSAGRNDAVKRTAEELSVRQVDWKTDRVSALLSIRDEEYEVRFAASEDIYDNPDFLLPVTLLPAMRARVPLKLSGGAVSPLLLSTVPKIQNVLRLWDEKLFRPVPVSADAREVGVEHRPSAVACFFSGGVDSFYTLLERQDEITHLIHMELPLTDTSVQEQVFRGVREVAEEMGKALIKVDTNLMWFGKSTRVSWKYFHGARLSSVGLLFQHLFRKVLIPATFDYGNLFPWGSHPLLDPLWSTELVEFEHHGCDATRPEKIAAISNSGIAMQWLRVCYKDPHAYNCGRCEKCLRTMIALQAAGALKRCKTLPDNLDLEAVANLSLSGEVASAFARQNLKVIENRESEAALAETLAEALRKSELARSDARGEPTERAGSPVRNDQDRLRIKLRRERERGRRLAQQLEEARRPWYRRLFGG
jgi:hypothetical protein